MSIGIIRGAILAWPSRRRCRALELPRTIADGRGTSYTEGGRCCSRPDHHAGKHERARRRRHRLDRGRLVETAAGRGWTATLWRTGSSLTPTARWRPAVQSRIDLHRLHFKRGRRRSGEWLRLVKASDHCEGGRAGKRSTGRRWPCVLFYSGDHSAAKAEVGSLIDHIGSPVSTLVHSRSAAGSHNSRWAIAEPESLEDRMILLKAL